MSIPSFFAGAAEGRKAGLPKLFFLPMGGNGWDIAKYVMYCHRCGALSETWNNQKRIVLPCFTHGFCFFRGRIANPRYA